MPIELKAGCQTDDIRLDRIFEEDWRSLEYPVTLRLVPAVERKPRSYTHGLSIWLDQGSEGACVGFGCSHELASKPVAVTGLTNQFARERVYWEAQKDDPWPGGSYPGASPRYEGTSVLSGVKVLEKLGFYKAYHWALDIRQLGSGIGYAGGPAICGFNWYEGMMRPDASGFIAPTGKKVGGHCILAVGIKVVWKNGAPLGAKTWDDVDMDKSYITLHNSWGSSWGQQGRCKLTLANADRLLNEDGDACFPERNTKLKKVS